MNKSLMSTKHLQVLVGACEDWLSDFCHLMKPEGVKAISAAIKAGKQACKKAQAVSTKEQSNYECSRKAEKDNGLKKCREGYVNLFKALVDPKE